MMKVRYPTMKRQNSNGDNWPEYVSSELYEELLNRYERALVFAGQLQEKIKQGKLLAERNNLLAEKNTSLVDENERLLRLLEVEQEYVGVLENALEGYGLLEGNNGLEKAS